MSKIVEVPGVGNVEFPDSMSDDEIGKTLAAQKPTSSFRPGMGDVQAAPSAQPPPAPPSFLHRALQFAGGAVLPRRGSALDAVLPKSLDEYRSEPLDLTPPASPRRPGETDQEYAVRSAHEGLRWMGSPEGIDRSMAVVGNTLPGGGGGSVLERPAAALERFAGERNIKAAGAIQTDIVRARRQVGREQLNKIGQEMGPLGLVGVTSTPTKTYELAGKLMDKAGAEMGGTLKAADQVPAAALNSTDLLKRAAQDVLGPMLEDPHQADAAEKFTRLLGRYADRYQGRDLTPSELHQVRKNISKDLYGWRGNKDPEADAVKSALHDFRSIVTDELNQAVERGGQSTPEWLAQNRRYEIGARTEEFADKGMDRAHGNNLISPMEALAGMTALAGGTASGHGGAGVSAALATVAAALARRHGSGTLGKAAQGTANALRRTSLLPSAESRAAALAYGARPINALSTPALGEEDLPTEDERRRGGR